MVEEPRAYSLFHLVNRLVKEARRNEEVFGEKKFTIESLTRSLSHQAPNRLFVTKTEIF